MGADLCLEYVTIKKSKKPVWKNGLARIKTLEKKWAAEQKASGEEEELFELDVDIFGYPITPKDALDQLKSDFAEFKTGITKYSREIAKIVVGNHIVYITGGMTWGDDPSDMYGVIQRLCATGISKACGFDS